MRFLSRPVLLLGFLLLFVCTGSYAAFPVRHPVAIVSASVTNNSMGSIAVASEHKEIKAHGLLAKALHRNTIRPIRYQWAAIILNVTSLLLGGLGAHRFYLGYTAIGVAQLSGLLWLGAGALLAFGIGTAALPPVVFLGVLMIGVFAALYIWQIIDLIRIAKRRLQPKRTDYEHHRFLNQDY